jgi:hypothetical protein
MSINRALFPLLAALLQLTFLAACTPESKNQAPTVVLVPPTFAPTQPPDMPPQPPAIPTPISPNPEDSVNNPPQSTNPYAPQPGDENMQRSPAFVDKMDILAAESYPLQYRLELAGSLPTPCHQLRISIQEPDTSGNIYMEVYSLDSGQMCTQMLQPFDATIPLQYPPGQYTLWINTQQIGTLDIPAQ